MGRVGGRVSPTVAAALLLICQRHPLDEIVARLTRGELEQVAGIVGRCADHFPLGTLDALNSRNLTSSHGPSSADVSTDQAPSQRAARTSVESLHRHRARKRAGRPFEHPGKSTGRPFLGQRGASYGPVDALPSRRDTVGGHNTQKD